MMLIKQKCSLGDSNIKKVINHKNSFRKQAFLKKWELFKDNIFMIPS